MAETIIMPKLGFDMAEGTLVRWVKKEGETVKKSEVLAEIETDKATVEVESTAEGIVRKLLVDEGTSVPVSTPIAIVGTADEDISKQVSVSSAQSSASAQQSASNIKSPAPQAATAPQKAAKPVSPQSSVVNPQTSIVRASPLAKRIAREEQVDLSQVKGTGPGGRIVRKDIEAALAGEPTVDRGRPTMVSAPSPMIYRSSSAADETVGLTKLRQAIARRMAESKTTIPHFYVTHEFKMDALLDLRKQLNAFSSEEEKLSVNDFIVKAVALTLCQFPNLNASLNGNSVVRHGAVNIGSAVSVEGGLLTVVCRDADQKSLRQISEEIKVMAGRARQGKVKSDDIEGSTFSISNMGMYDVENFSAIINPPEAGILAVGSARQVPVILERDSNPAIEVGWRMKATIAVDHRISDGVEAAKFMQMLAVFLEEPLRLVL
jgi:pyruvate dehydrogenase E2 component (dihydrolipoamide acetyltransferase)